MLILGNGFKKLNAQCIIVSNNLNQIDVQNVQKILRISKIARTIAFLSIFALKIVNEKNGKCSLKEFVANFKYFRNIYKKTKLLQTLSISGPTNRIAS